MKTPSTSACLLAALLFSTASAASSSPGPGRSVAAASEITAVTIYADRAVVTRTAALDLAAAGTIEITFERLPASLLDQSLQVAGRGAAEATILDVTARSAHVDFTPNERVKALEDELRALQRQRRVSDDRGAMLKGQDATLIRLETAATAPPLKDGAPRLSLEESGQLLAFLDEKRGKIAAERQALDIGLEELAAKQSAAERQLNELRGAGGRTYKTVAVRLDVATAGKLELALSYAVPGASWTPSYDARVTSGERAVTLGYFGLARQNTGEDWKDVALTLSTARPALDGAAPEQRPWALDVLKPVGYGGAGGERREMAMGSLSAPTPPVNLVRAKRAANMAVDATGEMADRDAGVAAATVEAGATSASFKIAAAASVPSDNSPQKIPVTSARLAAAPEYLTVPKRLAAAFLTAKVSNQSEFPLLAGPLNVFLDGTFVATSALRTVMPGEKFDLALGADEGIGVKHKRVQRFTEDTGLTNSGKRITYEYLLTIQNNKKTAEHVVVADQVPVSRNEKIVVKVLAPDAKEARPAADGTLKWTLDLKPAEKRELTLKFSVDHPNDVAVAGLEP